MTELLTLYTPEETGDVLKISPATLAKWRMDGTGPRFMKCGNRIRYSEKDLIEFVQAQTISHTGQTGSQLSSD